MKDRTGPPTGPKPVSMSAAEARRLIVAHLFRADPERDVAQALGDFGYVQIDTISRVERAHHHCLWSRVDGYRPADLDAAVARGDVFEYWSHAAAYLPMKNYRYCLPRMERMRTKGFEWFEENRTVIAHVLDRIRAEGPLMTRDFKDERHSSDGWWDWKPAKIALEHLFHQGRLIVKGRKGFQKVYALPEDVLPGDLDTTMPGEKEMAAYLVDLSLRNTGLSRGPYLRFQHHDGREKIAEVLAEELEAGCIVAVDVEGSGAWYCRPEFLVESDRLSGGAGPTGNQGEVKILSPFDGLVIQRGLIEELFGFRYQIECYVPAEKRRYGYFSLPIVDGRGFAGLVDAGAERKEGILRIYALHLYQEHRRDKDFKDRFAAQLKAFARFNGCKKIAYDKGARRRFP